MSIKAFFATFAALVAGIVGIIILTSDLPNAMMVIPVSLIAYSVLLYEVLGD